MLALWAAFGRRCWVTASRYSEGYLFSASIENLFPVKSCSKWLMGITMHTTPCLPTMHDTRTSLTQRTTPLRGCGHRCCSHPTQSALVATAFGVLGEEKIAVFGNLCLLPACSAILRRMAVIQTTPTTVSTAAKWRLNFQLLRGLQVPP